MQFFTADALMFLTFFLAPENIKKPPSKVAHNRPRPFFFNAANWPKSQFLFHNNLPPQDFSILTLPEYATNVHSIICKVKICLLFLQALNILQDPAID